MKGDFQHLTGKTLTLLPEPPKNPPQFSTPKSHHGPRLVLWINVLCWGPVSPYGTVQGGAPICNLLNPNGLSENGIPKTKGLAPSATPEARKTKSLKPSNEKRKTLPIVYFLFNFTGRYLFPLFSTCYLVTSGDLAINHTVPIVFPHLLFLSPWVIFSFTWKRSCDVNFHQLGLPLKTAIPSCRAKNGTLLLMAEIR